MGLDYKLLTRSGSVQHERNGPAVAATLDPPRAVLELVPESVARENLVLPLALDGETLTVAAAHPSDLLASDIVTSPDPRYPGLDPTPPIRNAGMIHYVVEEGQRALVVSKDGRMDVVVGPKRVRTWGKTIRPMKHFVAHPGEFLVVRFRD